MFLEDGEVVKIKREDVIGVLKESLVKKYEINIDARAKTFKYYVEEV